ncbi:nose resistant to fluoxetine protein 6 [Amyelois transitella]|uniref:nose resistant to fluoxetine protein 6 n=1 Tax=Amyelois transitella TaxID=680683 RepID=UPI00067A7C78|nr:nose resistant to fluoxetine protein 6 [Amyelois transitella]
MNVMWAVLTFVLVLGVADTEKIKNDVHNKMLTYADILRDAIEVQQWNSNEECLGVMLEILDNAKNSTLWAVQIIDSLQPPVGQLYGQKFHFGNYDECLNPNRGFLPHPDVPNTQYCLVDVTLTRFDEYKKPEDYVWNAHNVTTENYIKKPTKHGRVLSSMFLGVCVPKSCQISSVAKITRSILSISHFGAFSDSASINSINCQNNDTKEDLSSLGFNIFTKVVLLLSFITAICTILLKNDKVTPNTFVGELVRSFCLTRNIESLTTVRDEEVFSINFLRVITCCGGVIAHYYMFTYSSFLSNGLYQDSLMDDYGRFKTHVDVLLENFLVMSGLLFTRSLLSDRWQNPLKFIWKRYIRLVGALIALLFYMVTMSGQVTNGPVWHRALEEQKVCADNWLNNLLMMGNYDSDKLCVATTWYVPCDFQLCVFATIIYVIYKKSKTFGKYIFIIAFGLSIIVPGLITYVYDYPSQLFYGVGSMVDLKLNVLFKNLYVKNYYRAGSFMTGMVIGHLMHLYKPKYHRNLIGTFTSYFCVVSVLAVGVAILFSGHHHYLYNRPICNAIYASLNRTIWAIGVSVVIGVSEYGDLPYLNNFFAWKPLVPLSRLTYGVYISHYSILQLFFFSLRNTFALELFTLGLTSAGVIVYSLIASLLMWLFVEAPLVNINNMILDKTWKKDAQCNKIK